MQDDPQKLLRSVAEPLQPITPPPTNPAWAKDLRELYNAVVEEPLPDSFTVLLAQLDLPD